MTKKIATFAFAAAAVFVAPAIANATTVAGRVTAFSPTSITVLDKEAITVGINDATVFTKLTVQKPWQEDTAFSADKVRVGSYVIAHVPDDGAFVAKWVQVSLVGAPFALSPVAAAPGLYNNDAVKHLREAADRRANPTASESKRPGSVDTAAHCERIANEGANFGATPKGEPYNNRLQKLGK